MFGVQLVQCDSCIVSAGPDKCGVFGECPPSRSRESYGSLFGLTRLRISSTSSEMSTLSFSFRPTDLFNEAPHRHTSIPPRARVTHHLGGKVALPLPFRPAPNPSSSPFPPINRSSSSSTSFLAPYSSLGFRLPLRPPIRGLLEVGRSQVEGPALSRTDR